MTSVIVTGITVTVMGPVAEEVFWRGYLLEQFRKLAPGAIALLIQSVLFGLAHLHLRFGTFTSIQAVLIGTALGVWRIRFRSLLPLILAHVVFNGIVLAPVLSEQYEYARLAESLDDDVAGDLREHFKHVRASPKCREIEALIGRPAWEAVPAILDLLADPEETVRDYAQTVIIAKFRREAEPYMKASLASHDMNTLSGALFIVGLCRYSIYAHEVRNIAWGADDLKIRISAVTTLLDLHDEEGLRGVAKYHPNAQLRSSAERCLGYLADQDSARRP